MSDSSGCVPLSGLRIVLLTGERGAGKSFLCERVARAAREQGIAARGVVCPGVFGPDGSKRSTRARDLASGEEWELGSLERDLGGPRWKGWSFSENGFRKAVRAVITALGSGPGLAVLDEIGPVELRLGAGLEPALRSLDEVRGRARQNKAALYPVVIFVVRPELLPEVEARYPGAEIERISVEDRDAAFRSLSARVFRDGRRRAPGSAAQD